MRFGSKFPKRIVPADLTKKSLFYRDPENHGSANQARTEACRLMAHRANSK
jgi:hypothetical protein